MSSTECQNEVSELFINKAINGRNNLCGNNVAQLRKKLNISQKKLADRLQLLGLDIDKNAIQRIESGQRFVTDIEIAVLSNFFDVSSDYLINNQD